MGGRGIEQTAAARLLGQDMVHHETCLNPDSAPTHIPAPSHPLPTPLAHPVPPWLYPSPPPLPPSPSLASLPLLSSRPPTPPPPRPPPLPT